MMAVTLVFLRVLTAVFSFPMHVSAGEMLGENDFDSGKGLPWHICESATAKWISRWMTVCTVSR